jgi:hypothetical protein
MPSDGYGLPKVSAVLAMSYLSMPCGRATLETVLRSFRGGPLTGRVACGHLLPLKPPQAVRLCTDLVCFFLARYVIEGEAEVVLVAEARGEAHLHLLVEVGVLVFNSTIRRTMFQKST